MLTESSNVSALLKSSFGGTSEYPSHLHGLADTTWDLWEELHLPIRWAAGGQAGCTHCLK